MQLLWPWSPQVAIICADPFILGKPPPASLSHSLNGGARGEPVGNKANLTYHVNILTL